MASAGPPSPAEQEDALRRHRVDVKVNARFRLRRSGISCSLSSRKPCSGGEVRMATRRKGLSPLEQDVLRVAAERRGGVIWLSEESLETMAQTHRAMLRLEKLELLE